jgi:phthiocerol/phenolphthiocerol synthesis type-I polyketide synthase E
MAHNELDTTGIAIIGMSARFPGAPDLRSYWDNLRAGRESIETLDEASLLASGVDPSALADPSYVRVAPVLRGIDQFDAPLFDISPAEARQLDPQHRLFLECAWEAIEHGGYRSAATDLSVGVYGSSTISTYMLNNLIHLPAMRRGRDGLNLATMQICVANDKDFLSTRVSFKLDLRGPAYTVQSACSSSLVAVHVACQALLARECDLALAGGASVKVPQHVGYFYEPGAIVSPDGHCRAFDAEGNGTVFGSGVGVVLLRRLDDALVAGDHIWAVIRGSAANNDGSLKMAFTAPSVEAQARVIEEALDIAGVSADTISYVEAHGTGTNLGDPVEVAALTQAFRATTQRKQYCAIGSVKTNVGHLETAAGIAGLIKVALMLHHKEIPATLHFKRPNPQLDLDNSPFFVNAVLRPWDDAGAAPRRAGLTSLGVGGTNVHLVLEEAPPPAPAAATTPWQLLTLSAHSAASLDEVTRSLGAFASARADISLADVAYTLHVGRVPLRHRRIAVCRDTADAARVLSGAEPARLLTRLEDRPSPPVVFMFPGQGTQYPNMGLELRSADPTFRTWVDTCADILRPALGRDLRSVLYPTAAGLEAAAAELEQTALTQPALFVVEYALARAWMERGVTPGVLMGHSVGELVGACLAGVFSLEDALGLIALRGQLVQGLPLGSMLSVAASPEAVTRLMSERLSIAAVNEAGRCVVSGPTEDIDECARALAAAGIEGRRLHTSHAFHSAMLEPVLDGFAQAVARVRRSAPTLRCLSNVTGTWMTDDQAQDPRYWAQQLRRPVRFADQLGCALSEGPAVLLEVGPGRSLARFAQAHPARSPDHAVVPSMRHASESGSDWAALLGALGQAWLHGVTVDWRGHWGAERRRRQPIPTYCFDRQRYWIDAAPEPRARGVNAAVEPEVADPVAPIAGADVSGAGRPELSTPYAAPRSATEETLVQIWGELLGIGRIGIYDNFFELGGDSVLGVQVAGKANACGMRLSPKHLFDYQCVAELAAAIDDGRASSAAAQDDAGGPQPLLPNQCWIVERMPEFRSWISITVLEAREPIEVQALEDALLALRQHHSALRTRFVESSGGWTQEVVAAPRPTSVARLDLLHLGGPAFHARVDAYARELCDEVDLATGEVLRVAVVRGNPARGKNDRLILAIHHWVQDQWGERILMQDLELAYGQRRAGGAIELPATATSMTGFAAVLAERAEAASASAARGEWLRPARAEVRPLPWRPYTGVRSPARVVTIERMLEESDTSLLLSDLQRARRVTLEEITVSAAVAAVAAWSGERDLLVDILMSARQVDLEGVDLTRALGWFSTIYPLHVDLRGAGAPLTELDRAVQAMRRVRHLEQEYGMLRYVSTDSALRARLAGMPQADLFFAYFGKKDDPEAGYARALGEGFFRVDPDATDMKRTMMGSFRYAIEIAAYVSEGVLHVGWLVNQDLLGREVAEAIADGCMRNLRVLARSSALEGDREGALAIAGAAVSSDQLNDILAELGRAQV